MDQSNAGLKYPRPNRTGNPNASAIMSRNNDILSRNRGSHVTVGQRIQSRLQTLVESDRLYPSQASFSVCRAKNLLFCLIFLEPRPSKLAPVRYNAEPNQS
jgi:hypothetical protein